MQNDQEKPGKPSESGQLSQIDTGSLKLTQLSQNETASQIETGPNVAGAGSLESVQTRGAALGSDKIFHAKATRHICGKYPGLNLYGLEFTAALSAFLVLSARENVGVNVQDVVHWSGARTRWKKRMYEGAREAEEMGCIERIRSGDGYVLDLTAKGRRVLDDYDRKMEELREVFEVRRAVNALKMATRRLKMERRRAGGEARRSLEM